MSCHRTRFKVLARLQLNGLDFGDLVSSSVARSQHCSSNSSLDQGGDCGEVFAPLWAATTGKVGQFVRDGNVYMQVVGLKNQVWPKRHKQCVMT